MSINDLDLILEKDPIISTWAARNLQNQPERVEKDYLIHAKTHLSLGDTAKYVDTTFKWVSGANKGTFIGAVLGEYGEGKTSFLVHIWAESREQKICAVPPFEWSAFEDIIDAVAGWTEYILKRDTRLDLAKKVERVYQTFRQQSIEDLARDMAKNENKDYELLLDTVHTLVNSGKIHLADMSADRLLDFTAQVSEIVSEAGYNGLLILLDEPEVAAKRLGNETVQLFLFNLANELHQRQGNYGVFISMPANFYANAQARFSALTARLEIRGCFPRLGDIYGPDFAESLWQRYVTEFELGKEGQNVVTQLTLKGIGQVGSSDHRDLSYGPRSVISIFRRMVNVYRETNKPYQNSQFIQDILDQEILVKPEYRSKLHSVFNSQLVNDDNRKAITLLATFPAGLHQDTIEELGLDDILRPLARTDGLLYRTAFTMGLRALRNSEGTTKTDPLRDMIEEIDGEYAPDRRAFNNAISAFARDIIPLIFQPRKGQQLVNWQVIHPIENQLPGVYFGTLLGAFEQTSRSFPYRAALLLIRGFDDDWQKVKVPSLDISTGPQKYDLFFHITLRWHTTQPEINNIVEVKEQTQKSTLIFINLDLTQNTLEQENLAEVVGSNRLTPLWVLNLFERMNNVDFARDIDIQWQGLYQFLSKQFLGLFFNNDFNSSVIRVVETNLEEQLTGSGLQLIDRLTNLLLKRRYPDYETLIRQSRWQGQIDNYINALTSNEIPLASKRGREPWLIEKSESHENLAARTLGTSRANLSGGAFTGFENLIQITSKGRHLPLEVEFRMHPLEQEIREIIMAQPRGADRKFKREGKEGWYIPRTDLLPMILGKGYTTDELNKIIAIGKARQTFLEDEHKKESVLYCLPLAPEELKDQLQAKLADLVAEIGDFNKLPDYRSSFDISDIERKIEILEDDADYERLMSRMNKEFEQNHNRLPGYFDRVQEKFTQVRKKAQGIRDKFLNAREVKQLDIPPSTSPWGTHLGRYIVSNLQQEINDFSTKSKEVLDRLDANIMRFTYSKQRKPRENIDLSLEGWAEANSLEGEDTTLLAKAQDWGQKLKDYTQWLKMLRYSDKLYNELLDLKKDAEHQDKSQELLSTFDTISQKITDHIELRNVNGLSAYQQFQKQFEELEQARVEYLSNLKGLFDKDKDKVNQLIEQLKLDNRVRVTFNPQDIVSSYEQLYTDFVQIIRTQGIEQALEELVTQERELIYARDILQVTRHTTDQRYLDDSQQQQDVMNTLKDELTSEWLRRVIKDDDQSQIQRIVQDIANAFETAKKTRKRVQAITKPKTPTEGRLKTMYDAIPQQKSIDLKSLILQMMANETGDSKQVLDVSLESLAELFRDNCIQINVERRTR